PSPAPAPPAVGPDDDRAELDVLLDAPADLALGPGREAVAAGLVVLVRPGVHDRTVEHRVCPGQRRPVQVAVLEGRELAELSAGVLLAAHRQSERAARAAGIGVDAQDLAVHRGAGPGVGR